MYFSLLIGIATHVGLPAWAATLRSFFPIFFRGRLKFGSIDRSSVSIEAVFNAIKALLFSCELLLIRGWDFILKDFEWERVKQAAPIDEYIYYICGDLG